MALTQNNGPVPAVKPDMDKAIERAKGGQSRNVLEIVRHIHSEDAMFRGVALDQLAGNMRALAYLAVTSEYSDVREGAMKRLLKDSKGLFKLLNGLTGRPPEPWERKLVDTMGEIISKSNGDKILGLKVWQLQDSAPFRPSGSCPAADGKRIEFIDESPATANFSSDVLTGMIEGTQE
ncbi:MAG: hypothetical protein PHQ80_03345 [Candidatus ainarchaeum sp.]|nr:hypothetical protein [Candidatus ainarchaeum sp.]MDD5096527.1 hypothetical protein [Candidatus ainarchaeum sp.]